MRGGGVERILGLSGERASGRWLPIDLRSWGRLACLLAKSTSRDENALSVVQRKARFWRRYMWISVRSV